MTRSRSLAASLAVLLATSLAAPARAGLADEADLNAGLRAVAVADMIRKRCPEIEPRMVRALGYLRSLALDALDRGYSEAAIRAYVKDDAARDRVEAHARDYLAARGLGAGAPRDYCRVGRAEIAAGTATGALLRAR